MGLSTSDFITCHVVEFRPIVLVYLLRTLVIDNGIVTKRREARFRALCAPITIYFMQFCALNMIVVDILDCIMLIFHYHSMM